MFKNKEKRIQKEHSKLVKEASMSARQIADHLNEKYNVCLTPNDVLGIYRGEGDKF